MEYDTDLSQSQVVKVAGEKQGKEFDRMTLWYDYPYQASNISDKYLHWLFMFRSMRSRQDVFSFSFSAPWKFGYQMQIPRFLRIPLIKLINRSTSFLYSTGPLGLK